MTIYPTHQDISRLIRLCILPLLYLISNISHITNFTKCIQPLYAPTHLLIQTPELSELDQRVLNEILSDPSFMKSLEARGVQPEDGENFDGEKRPSRTMPVNQQSPTSGALASVGMVAPNASYRNSTSGFESATMQVVEKLQDSLRGVLAKVSATLESAGETL